MLLYHFDTSSLLGIREGFWPVEQFAAVNLKNSPLWALPELD